MFYDFNRHKQQPVHSEAVRMDDLARKYHEHRKACKRRLVGWKIQKMFRIPAAFRLAIFFTALGFGACYCLILVLPTSLTHRDEHSLVELTDTNQTIRAATESPKQQAFQHYLDSLERAFVADSILHSKQTIEDNAENNIHP
ncbi:hypothetical protein [Dyadobacter luticola]|uniref:Uncharacterized protein n=1 Tax=Dyadobacter luticola TaxID=1979387 RepID=A0A5R9KYN0_9BACT|nr:hypothetical protein [Dyadobacter luticola]TLV01422.1 hypothetical protein FEN17_18500 [Dyadobacter luticola]